jgi:uncharacterized protein YfkK (UPF0435 family)
MDKIIQHEDKILGLINQLSLDTQQIEGIKLIFHKLKGGQNLSYSEYQLLEVLYEIWEDA